MHETTVILDRLVVVKLDATLWGGRKKLRKEDLILADGSVLPPEDLASLGSKRIADPKDLAVFHRLKKEAERHCLKAGTRFLGGFAIPEGSLDRIRQELERLAVSFAAARAQFLARYDQTIEDWVARHPAFAPAIRRAVDPVHVVAANLRFDYVVFRVSPPEPSAGEGSGGDDLVTPPSAVNQPLARRIGCLSETLFREIAQDARDLVDSSLLGKTAVTRKALSPLKRMREKLDGLAFLDHRVQPVVETLGDLLERVPKSGPLEGAYLGEVLATALLLSDPEKIRRHGEGLLSVADVHPLRREGPNSVPAEVLALADPALDLEAALLDAQPAEAAWRPLEADLPPEPALADDYWF
jgi:hypothetical protein